MLPFLTPLVHRRAAAVDTILALGDFGAFYCAARIARTGGDPYALAPLRACEVERVDAPGNVSYARVGIDPAPLPGYDFVFFAPLTFFDFRAAGIAWTLLLASALFAAADALRRLTHVPYWAALALLSTADGVTCLSYGQEQPLVTLALAGSALCSCAGRANAAAVVASASLLEPHVGIPVLLALGIWTRARVAVATLFAAAAGATLAFGGVPRAMEYVTRVLPAHAHAELAAPIQFSLATILNAAGMSDRSALGIASVQYVVIVALGIAACGALARRMGSPAIVLFPAACAVTGGTFMHVQELASALPFALFAAATVPAIAPLAWIGAAAIALPWPGYGYGRAYFVLDVAIVAATTTALGRRPAVALATTAAACALYFAAGPLARHAPATALGPRESAATLTSRDDRTLASTQYAIESRTAPDDGATAANLLARLPVWIGIVAVVASGAFVARRTLRIL